MSDMTSLERCLAALRWKKPDRIPVVPQNSDMAIHLAGFDMIEASKDGRKIALALLESQMKFGYDGHFLGPDAAILAEALGCKIGYRKDDPPAVTGPVLEKLEDIDKLKMVDPYKDGRMPQWLKALEILKERSGDRVLIIGRADQGAFSLACLLRGMDQLMMDIAMGESDELIHKLLNFCNLCHIEFARAIQQAGAHVTTCGDAYGGPSIIGALNYAKYVFPYEKAAAATIQHEIGIPYTIHICGCTNPIADKWPETGAAAFEVDHKTDVSLLRKATLGKNTIIGNLDTDMLTRGTPQDVEKACHVLFDMMMPQSGFLLSSGCSMLANTKAENLSAMVEAARKFGVYA
jgi:Uroporphyrinogen-III decarboxylase